jgi:hypothetical protein
MQENGAVQLVGTSLVAVGSNVTDSKTWNGGVGVLVLGATQIAPVANLMLLGPTGSWIKMNSSSLQANTTTPLYLPAGSYRIETATGSSIGVVATLVAMQQSTIPNATGASGKLLANNGTLPYWGPVYSDPALYTPTNLQGVGSTATTSLYWSQMGKLVFVHGTITCGSSTASELQIGLPAGITSSANYGTGAGSTLIEPCGVWTALDQGTNGMGFFVLIQPSKTYVNFGRQGSSANALARQFGNNLLLNGGVIMVSFYIKID